MAFAPDETTHNASPTLETPKTAPKGASPYLVVIAGPSFGEMYRLRGDRVVVGRGDRTDVRIVDDGISREHVAVQREGGKVVLVDLGSTNGTYCNGMRVPRQELTDGDKISIGAATILKFTYQDHGEHTFTKGDCILQPPGIVHNELDCSDDVEILEIYSPAVHETKALRQVPEAAAAVIYDGVSQPAVHDGLAGVLLELCRVCLPRQRRRLSVRPDNLIRRRWCGVRAA